MTHGSLFSGIGGFDLAAEAMGWTNVFHCEKEPSCQQVLQYYWPDAELFDDIKEFDGTKYRGTIDIISGGFPCQPFSLAGKRKGTADDRHLWPEMLRIIREIQPRWVVGENVFGLINWDGGLVFDQVHADLEAEGYEVQAYVLPACGVNAPHQRYRVWFVGYAQHYGPHAAEKRRDEQKPPEPTGENQKRQPAGAGGAQSGAWVTQHTKRQPNGRHNTRASAGTGMDMERNELDATGRHQSANNAQPPGGDAANAHSSRLQTEGPEQPTAGIAGGCAQGAPANAGSQQLQNRAQDGKPQDTTKKNAGVGNRIERPSNVGDATNADKQRHEECEFTTQPSEQERQHSKTNITGEPGSWENFPTQSPVCTGDDGLSAGLDGITFPKWRNESIKAAGNAVVPQVVMQIFNAIKQYECTEA